MTIVGWLCGAMLSAAALIIMVQVFRGPGLLNRLVAMDAFLATSMCAIAIDAAFNGESTHLPVLVGLALVGFLGNVVVARQIIRRRQAEQS